MRSKIKDLGSITTGVYKKGSFSGDAFYLQGAHFDKDLLLIAKGNNNRACIYYENYGKALASSLFFVIRVDQEIVIPEYLQWYINTPMIQTKLGVWAKGSHIPSLSKKSLMELEIYLPSLTIQKQIIHVDSLWQRERIISEQLINDKENYYQQSLINLAKEKS